MTWNLTGDYFRFKKMAGQKEDKQDFRANLKVVKKDNVIDDIVNKVLFFFYL